MDDKEINNKIKTIVHSFLPDARILLFGSRANGLTHKDSDYDLLIVTGTDLTQKEKMTIGGKISKSLVWALDVPFDVLLKDKKEVERYKDAKAHIIYYALKEAIML